MRTNFIYLLCELLNMVVFWSSDRKSIRVYYFSQEELTKIKFIKALSSLLLLEAELRFNSGNPYLSVNNSLLRV